jgi:DNA polymerase-3 subunit epsilon
MEEFARVGLELDMSRRRMLDMQRIFYKMEPRTLRAALKFFTGKRMENAHDALADVRATIDVFKGQLEKYQDVDYEDEDGQVVEKPVQNDMQAIHSFFNDDRFVDATQRIKYGPNKELLFNFGKYAGRPVVEVLKSDKNYGAWILNKEFSVQVKQIIRQLMKEHGI